MNIPMKKFEMLFLMVGVSKCLCSFAFTCLYSTLGNNKTFTVYIEGCIDIYKDTHIHAYIYINVYNLGEGGCSTFFV